MTGAAVQKAFWCTIVTLFQMEEIKEKNFKKKIAQLLSQKTSFVNCQQHKYFVLLFVPFCKKKMKKKNNNQKKTKRERVCCFKRVFIVPLQSWFPNTVQYMRSLADQPCNIDAELEIPCQHHVL